MCGCGRTLGDHALQSDDVGVVKLSHDAGLSQEVPPLPLRVAALQSLYGHRGLLPARGTQAAATHLTKLSCGHTHTHTNTFRHTHTHTQTNKQTNTYRHT